MSLRFTKEMPGAELIASPDNIDSYSEQSWDIRISIGNAPLDEAFFFPMENFSDLHCSIRELLENFALNPDKAEELDTDNYPELPFLQQELIQYFQGLRKGTLELKIYTNHGKKPIDLETPARDLISACIFRNKSWDYLVLDLVFCVDAPRIDSAEKEAFIARHISLKQNKNLQQEAIALQRKYDRYSSVSVAPCTLGIPDGFDVRLQMMEFDGLAPEWCLLVQMMAFEQINLDDAFEPTCEALQYQTHFSVEILKELKACGQVFENA